MLAVDLWCISLDLEESDFLTSLRTHHTTEKDAANYHSSNKSEVVMNVSTMCYLRVGSSQFLTE